jgi:hypothetical protein
MFTLPDIWSPMRTVTNPPEGYDPVFNGHLALNLNGYVILVTI